MRGIMTTPQGREPRNIPAFPQRDLPDVDCLVMGSDFPHAEGMAEPADFSKLLDGLSEEQQHKILRGNAEKLFTKG